MGVPGICIVGCGQIAAAHARRLKGKARLYFQSRRLESAEALNQSADGAGVFGGLDDALGVSEVDAIMITSPPEAHAGQVIRALEADKTVFVEKPMCLRRAEIDAIEDAVRDKPVVVGENYYYKPSLALLKRWLTDEEIGVVQRIRLRKCMTQATSGWKSAYGSLFEGGIHFVALLNGLLGSPTSIEAAFFPGRVEDEPERHSLLEMCCGDVDAELEYSWNTPSVSQGVLQHSEIVGDRGRIVFESNGIYARLASKRACLRFPGIRDLMGYGAMLDDFLECIKSGRVPVSSLERAREDLETVFKAYELGGLKLPA